MFMILNNGILLLNYECLIVKMSFYIASIDTIFSF